MLNLNETITAYDMAEALNGETGKFEVITPNGERLVVSCSPGHSLVHCCSQTEGGAMPFRIRKIAEYTNTTKQASVA